MTPLRKAMIKAMQIRGFSQRTHQSYLAAVADLARYTRCSPDRLSPAQVNGYFEYLVTERELAPASCRLIVAKPNSIIEVSIMSARRQLFFPPIESIKTAEQRDPADPKTGTRFPGG